jgi:hypothetical protein
LQRYKFGEHTSCEQAPSTQCCPVAVQSVDVVTAKPSALQVTSVSSSHVVPGSQTQGAHRAVPFWAAHVVRAPQAVTS